MASHRMTADTGARADAVLAVYVADLSARLRGPRRHRDAILAELRDGLDQTTEAHIAAGQPPERAATAAIDEFGPPQAVADSFAAELATSYARRTIVWYIATGPLVGIWWLLLLHPSPWHTSLIALITAIPAVPLIAVAIAAAAGTIATTGRLMRWLPETGPHHALAATLAVATLCTIGDLTMIAVFALSATPARPIAVIAIAASITRIASSITVMRHATRMRLPRPASPRQPCHWPVPATMPRRSSPPRPRPQSRGHDAHR